MQRYGCLLDDLAIGRNKLTWRVILGSELFILALSVEFDVLLERSTGQLEVEYAESSPHKNLRLCVRLQPDM